MEIILSRHGEPKVKLKNKVNAQELKQLVTEYAQTGISGLAPDETYKTFKSHYVVCSHLERSIQSAHSIGFEKVNLTDKLFAECELPHFDHGILKLPIIVWLLSLRAMWLFGFSKNAESFIEAKKRAKQAANRLIILAQKHDKVILIGHGLMNRLIAKQLKINEWRGPGSPGKKYWAFAVYAKDE